MAAARVQISGVTWIYRLFKEGGKCKHVHFQNGSVVPAIEPLHVSSHFRLKWFQFSANVMLSEDRKGTASLFQGSSIIHYNQNSSANPGNYWLQAASHVVGSRKHRHTHTHMCALLSDRMCHVRNQKHIYTLEGLKHALWLPLLSQRCYLTHFGIIKNSNQLYGLWQEHNGT